MNWKIIFDKCTDIIISILFETIIQKTSHLVLNKLLIFIVIEKQWPTKLIGKSGLDNGCLRI